MSNRFNSLTDKDRHAAFQNILNSKDFKDSAIYQELLTYLVKAAFAGKIPKEITIAIDVFGKNSDFNSNKDSTVRYHIHTLRGKLENYYKNEGKSEKIQLVIPKGHYEIEFVSSRGPQKLLLDWLIKTFKRWEIILLTVLIIVNFSLILRLLKIEHNRPEMVSGTKVAYKDPLWSSFFDNDYPVSIILGDDFMLDEYSPEYRRYRQIRDWKIDSKNDLYDFLVRHPKANLWASEITGVPFGGEQNLMDILPIIYQFQTNVSLYMSSELTLDQVRNHNLIYIGEFKNLRVLDKMIAKLPFCYQYRPDERLFILNENGDTVSTFLRIEAPYEQKDKFNVDYSLLIKIPGFAKENIMFIVGFGYGGRLERTKMMGNAELRNKFTQSIKASYQHFPEYFLALFEVKSIERTGFTNELKYFQEINPDLFSK